MISRVLLAALRVVPSQLGRLRFRVPAQCMSACTPASSSAVARMPPKKHAVLSWYDATSVCRQAAGGPSAKPPGHRNGRVQDQARRRGRGTWQPLRSGQRSPEKPASLNELIVLMARISVNTT